MALAARAPRGRRVSWRSAGSHKDEYDIWRGGVALGSYGDAAEREQNVISDGRGWGRYLGRNYRGKGGRVLVVVVIYAPDASYNAADTERGDYSQRLGERAAALRSGTSASKWKPGLSMPCPTEEQVKHPKRLLFSDLALHLWHYASKPKHTIVVMGDMNTDIYAGRRRGKDSEALVQMMDGLKLTSAAEAAWPRSHASFMTHAGDSVHADSHIDYVLISEASATAVRRYGIHADPNLCEDRGGRHAALFADIDVRTVLGIELPEFQSKLQTANEESEVFKARVQAAVEGEWVSRPC